MQSISQTPYYINVIKEFNYDFADVFIFDDFVISEIKEGVTFTWENHAKKIVEDVTSFTKCNGSTIIYLSHRIHSYSVMPIDWLNFYRNQFKLKGYGVIGYNSLSFVNTVIENLFFKKRIRRFSDLESAMQWATSKALVDLKD